MLAAIDAGWKRTEIARALGTHHQDGGDKGADCPRADLLRVTRAPRYRAHGDDYGALRAQIEASPV